MPESVPGRPAVAVAIVTSGLGVADLVRTALGRGPWPMAGTERPGTEAVTITFNTLVTGG